ncbi:hypothetical protein [Alteromonas sp. 009811495]|uniref:hypothetical protein n=1 Tax=Alteromonas sp. 009811495 TaxID=3002962 RepID=UPI00237DFB19|nr:hypothetical protein [Alteromonas sp. 009811495]WDT87532.1 hypothetical protein OZ660_07255 [Alteromonas sp. 009811495]
MAKLLFYIGIFLLLVVVGGAIFFSHYSARFGKVGDRCVDNFETSQMQYCVKYEFEYLTLTTSFKQPNGDDVSFNTDIIVHRGDEIKFEHYNIVVKSSTAISSAKAFIDSIKVGMESAANSGGFSSRYVKINGMSVTEPVTNDAGQRWSSVIENGQSETSIAKVASDMWERFNSENNRDGFILVTKPSGEPSYLIYAADGTQSVSADFAAKGNKSDHSGSELTFKASFPTRVLNGFMDAVRTFFESMDSSMRPQCRVAFNGDEAMMQAEVSCS